MKKIFSLLIAATLVISMGITSAYAANQGQMSKFMYKQMAVSGNEYSFTDADGDGVCDSCSNSGICTGNGEGARRGGAGARLCGSGGPRYNNGECGACQFVDADGDGVCDTCPNGGVRPLDGTGMRRGRTDG